MLKYRLRFQHDNDEGEEDESKVDE